MVSTFFPKQNKETRMVLCTISDQGMSETAARFLWPLNASN